MTTKSTERDLIKEYLTYIQVEKDSRRHTLESYRRDLARLDRWSSKNGKSVAALHDRICGNGLRNFLAKAWRRSVGSACVERRARFFRFLMLDQLLKAKPGGRSRHAAKIFLPAEVSHRRRNRSPVRDAGYFDGRGNTRSCHAGIDVRCRVARLRTGVVEQSEMDIHGAWSNCHAKGARASRCQWEKRQSIGCSSSVS